MSKNFDIYNAKGEKDNEIHDDKNQIKSSLKGSSIEQNINENTPDYDINIINNYNYNFYNKFI